MGLIKSLFGNTSDGSTIKVKEDGHNNKITADKYTHMEDGKHTHDSYKVNTQTGEYSEYTGGENSEDRSYNK